MNPQIAEAYLATQVRNRPVDTGLVQKYAEAMKAGHWNSAKDEQPIRFHDGVLDNGQHRLQAVMQSGMTIEFTVINHLCVKCSSKENTRR